MTERVAEVFTGVLGTSTKFLLNTQQLIVLRKSLASAWGSSLNLHNNAFEIFSTIQTRRVDILLLTSFPMP